MDGIRCMGITSFVLDGSSARKDNRKDVGLGMLCFSCPKTFFFLFCPRGSENVLAFGRFWRRSAKFLVKITFDNSIKKNMQIFFCRIC